ncbi:Crp/Fnr family transcriptional regulator [Achromobacter sp.]|jgi:CRP-like cAMP-binding protein|uniref:Crp/Fnr family transcriptional regulator n=1 Tax=Achromobacter sp. TaxID=134375 RepID=UPI002A45417F|nr:cyclic nucleotide-binding domain-containing protein [Giesbergeria sp.]
MDPLEKGGANVPIRELAAGERLFRAGDAGPVWQVSRGVLRLEVDQPSGTGLVHLALPGDLVGAEAVLTQPYAFCATAVVPCQLRTVDLDTEVHRVLVLAAAFTQGQQRAAGVMRLREGSVAQRLDHLLMLLQEATGEDIAAVRHQQLPQLREIAGIINAAPESVCRNLTQRLGRRANIAPVIRKMRAGVAQLS